MRRGIKTSINKHLLGDYIFVSVVRNVVTRESISPVEELDEIHVLGD